MKLFDIHPMANLVPMASETEFKALKEDIDLNGQLDPILLWRGMVVDGRNRQEACRQLGIESKTKLLDDGLTEEEVKTLVKSSSTRRNLTETQKIMSAVKYQKEYGGSNESVSRSWGVGLTSFKNGKYIETHKPEFIEALFQGNSVKIMNHAKGFEITSNKINSIAKLIKQELEEDAIEIDFTEEVILEFSPDALIKTEAGKGWFNDKMSSNNIASNNFNVRMDYIEHANLKFRFKE